MARKRPIRKIIFSVSILLICLLVLNQSDNIYSLYSKLANLPPALAPKVKEKKIDSSTTKLTGVYEHNGAVIALKDGRSTVGKAKVKDGRFELNFRRQEPGSELELLASVPGKFSESPGTTISFGLEYPTISNINQYTTTVTGSLFKDSNIAFYVGDEEYGKAKAGSSNRYSVKLKDKIPAGKKVDIKVSYGELENKFSVYVGNSWTMAKDSLGKFHRLTRNLDISKQFKATKELFEYSTSKGVKTLLAMAPPSVAEGVSIFENDRLDYSNKLNSEFNKLMADSGFDVFDVRKNFKKDNLLDDSLYYKFDHHWTTQTALRTAIYINEHLNKLHDLGLNPGNKFSYNNFYSQTYKDYFSGSIAQSNVQENAVEDFTKLWPKHDSSFTLRKYDKDNNVSNTYTGNFVSGIIEQSKITKGGPCYASYLRGYTGRVEIENHKADNDYNVLIISTSHGRPFTAFMSNFYKKTTFIDLQQGKFPGNTYELIDELEPDVLLFVYTSTTFAKTSAWEFDRNPN